MSENEGAAGTNNVPRKRRVAWGITGSGHRLPETVEVMQALNEQYRQSVDITVYLSKAGYQVAQRYRLLALLQNSFAGLRSEVDANTPFLAGALQLGDFDFLLIAPATSNTVAKIALGIADSLLSNAASMALKAFVPVYIQPSDYEEGVTVTTLPGGRELRLRMRREDVAHVKTLTTMEGVSILGALDDLGPVFQRHFGSQPRR